MFEVSSSLATQLNARGADWFQAIDDIGIVPPDSKHLRPILNAIEQPEHLV